MLLKQPVTLCHVFFQAVFGLEYATKTLLGLITPRFVKYEKLEVFDLSNVQLIVVHTLPQLRHFLWFMNQLEKVVLNVLIHILL